MLVLLLAAAISNAQIPPDFRVELHRGGCYGTCPVYTLTIDRSGITFDGEQFTAASAVHRKALAEPTLRLLVRALDRAHFDRATSVTYGHDCPQPWTDNPSATITVSMNGKTRCVQHYHGCEGSRGGAALTKLEDEIDAIASINQWRRYDPEVEGRRQIAAEITGCGTAPECDSALARIAENMLLRYERVDHDQNTYQAATVCRNATVEVLTQRLWFVNYLASRFGESELAKLHRSAEKTASIAANETLPRRGTTRTLTVPEHGEIFRDDVAAGELDALVDDARLAARGTRMRLVARPPIGSDARVSAWPAEDLAPLASLPKRTFTRQEWAAVAARLQAPRHDAFAGYRYVDGRGFGMKGPVTLELLIDTDAPANCVSAP